MLTQEDQQQEPKQESNTSTSLDMTRKLETAPGTVKSEIGIVSRALRVEWLGQTIASLCWIVSVFCYGISSVGDVLQLCAASAWFIANLAALATPQDD